MEGVFTAYYTNDQYTMILLGIACMKSSVIYEGLWYMSMYVNLGGDMLNYILYINIFISMVQFLLLIVHGWYLFYRSLTCVSLYFSKSSKIAIGV